MTIEKLIDFINYYTNNSTIHSNKVWQEVVEVKQEGIAFVLRLSSRDWLALRSFNWKEKSSFWIECLIYLLNEAYTEEARQMIIYIALNGTKENFFDAMKYINDFRRDVSIYTWLKLRNRSSEILRNN